MSNRSDLLYMHTIDGKPGYFDGEQIVFAEQREHWLDDYPIVKVVRSQRTILKQRLASIAYRKQQGWNTPQYDCIILNTRGGSIRKLLDDAP